MEENLNPNGENNITPIDGLTQNSAANVFATRLDLSGLNKAVEDIKGQLRKIVVGQDVMIELLITALLADGHVLIEGVPGIAKTLTAKIVAKSISVDFSRIQFTPDLMPSDVLGTSVFNLKTSDFELRKGPLFSNIVLIDEINRAPAKTQAALFEAMEERQITIDGETHKLAVPFSVLATQNPIDQEGTYRLPEAQLDRFIFKIEITYPTLEQEVQIITDFHNRKTRIPLDEIVPVLNAGEIANYRGIVAQVVVEEKLIQYIAEIVNNTRNNSSLYLGASPRASLAILNTSKAYAAINGRDFVTPEDIKFVATPVLRHRIMLTPEREMEGLTAADIIKQIIERVEIPR